jgi:Fe-S oxidoreductase
VPTQASAQVIATGCPYCHQMLNDSVSLRNLGKRMKVVDVATLLLDSVAEPAGTPAADPGGTSA